MNTMTEWELIGHPIRSLHQGAALALRILLRAGVADEAILDTLTDIVLERGTDRAEHLTGSAHTFLAQGFVPTPRQAARLAQLVLIRGWAEDGCSAQWPMGIETSALEEESSGTGPFAAAMRALRPLARCSWFCDFEGDMGPEPVEDLA